MGDTMYLGVPTQEGKTCAQLPLLRRLTLGDAGGDRRSAVVALRLLLFFVGCEMGLLTIARVGAAPQPGTMASCTPNLVGYDIVYVRAPRYGDTTDTTWPDTVRPLLPDRGADLRLLHPNCTEEVLFPRPEYQALLDAPIGNGSVADPNVSFDGKWVVFAYYHDQSEVNSQRCAGNCLSRKGADIYRLDITSRDVVRLTFQEFTPNTGNGAQFANCGRGGQGQNCPNVGVFNVGPAFVAQKEVSQPGIVFTSSRNNFLPVGVSNGAQRALQLFTMDWNGHNVQQIGYLNNSIALHPFQLADGRLMFTSWENQGVRDQRQFNLWTIAPDGTQWASLSGFGENATVHHFATQMANHDIVVVRYYNQNNNGFGDLTRFPFDPPGPDFLPVNSPNTYMPFQRPGQVDLTNWTDSFGGLAEDNPAPCLFGRNIYNDTHGTCAGGNASRIGKVTHPAVAPGDALLLVYSPGPANSNGIYINSGAALPFYDGGLYLMAASDAATGVARPANLVKILNDPAYNEQWPRPVVPYSALFPGQGQPVVWPALANTGNSEHALSAHTPFGLVGSSSLIWRDTDPRQPRDGTDPEPFNKDQAAWIRQGADAGVYRNEDIYAIRLLALLPSTDRSYPNNGVGFQNVGTERVRILGEVPVRHEGAIDATGNTDTSFLVRIPADTPFTFQSLDRNGMVLNMAQTWHQVRPGEARYNCGGCHAHSKTPLDFDSTVAGRAGAPPTDLALQTPLLELRELNGSPSAVVQNATNVTVEYFRDVRPILERRCSGCHQNGTSDGQLNLHADASAISCRSDVWPGTYYRLVLDRNTSECPSFGLGPPSGTRHYFFKPQLTRYLRAFQSRESLLVWKTFGARLDGRSNETRADDIDYDPTTDPVHPKLDTLRGLTWDEKLTVARWVDIGAPIGKRSFWGWFEDDLRPTLWVSPTLEEGSQGPVQTITVGAYDLESGIASNTLSVTFNVSIGGQSTGTNFAAGLALTNGGVLDVPLPAAVDLMKTQAEMTVKIQDNVGHTTVITRTFGSPPPSPSPSPSPSPPSQPQSPPPPTSRPADLSLSIIDTPDPVSANGKLRYTLVITNSGPSAATKVKLTDTLPAGVTLVSVVASQGSCSGTATISCNLGTIAKSSRATVMLVVRPASTGTVNNGANVAGTEADPKKNNNTATVTTRVIAVSTSPRLSFPTSSTKSPPFR